MADKKRGGRRKGNEDETWSKEDENMAKHVRFNCTTQTTLFQGNEVHYFSGSKAVDTLYESSYGSKAKKDPVFTNRQGAVEFMQRLLDKEMLWRARKLVPKKKNKDDEKTTNSDEKSRDKKEEESVAETENEEKKKEEGKKKKVKLEVHQSQVFTDGSDVYVWVYDPTPLYKKLIGLLMVLGTIVGCLFPLWPMWLRQGIYYLSIAGIGFFAVIIAIAILRTILFGLIWLATMGEHKLWILPNLTEDVGFFESFKPLYTYEKASEEKEKKNKKKADKKKKDKNSDADEPKEKKEVKEEKAEEEEPSGSASEKSQLSASEDEATDQPSIPSSPEDKPRKRRVRKDDGDFVMVSK